jgi:hypothetical protein
MAIPHSRRTITTFVLALALALEGCAHALEVKNLADYQATGAEPLTQRLGVGVSSPASSDEARQLAKAVGAELGKYGADVAYPYVATSGARPVDVVANLDVKAVHAGSGWNFLVNFPGFLVFAPAWHGYIYDVRYDIDVTLTSPTAGAQVDHFVVPVALDVRHASLNRTWTEVSWFEVGAIALVGGLVFTSYDDGVTPLVVRHSASTIGDHVARQIVAHMNATARTGMHQQPGAAATATPRM